MQIIMYATSKQVPVSKQIPFCDFFLNYNAQITVFSNMDESLLDIPQYIDSIFQSFKVSIGHQSP